MRTLPVEKVPSNPIVLKNKFNILSQPGSYRGDNSIANFTGMDNVSSARRNKQVVFTDQNRFLF